MLHELYSLLNNLTQAILQIRSQRRNDVSVQMFDPTHLSCTPNKGSEVGIGGHLFTPLFSCVVLKLKLQGFANLLLSQGKVGVGLVASRRWKPRRKGEKKERENAQ